MAMTGDDHDDDDWRLPLLLSCLAGASTCLGAAIVFVFPADRIEASMGFSLSLAASVMITVSLVSIGPECLEGVYDDEHDAEFRPGVLLQRLVGFGLGGLGYYWLSTRLLSVLPEPDHLGWLVGGGGGPSSRQRSTASTRGLPALPSSPRKLKVGDGLDDDDDDDDASMEDEEFLLGDGRDGGIEDSDDNDDDDDEEEEEERRSLLVVPRLPSHSPRGISQRIGSHSSHQLNPTNTGIRPGFTVRRKVVAAAAPEPTRGHATSLRGPRGSGGEDNDRRQKSWRVALLLFVSLLCHNFPEGLAVAASAVESPQLGITVALGILVHNIPEGIAIAVPCLAARPDSPALAFGLASASGLAEPLGAAVALLALRHTALPLGNILAAVAGIMCGVAVWELYPEALSHARQHHTHRHVAAGTAAGALLMVATEWYLPS